VVSVRLFPCSACNLVQSVLLRCPFSVMRLYAPAIGKTAPPVASHLGSGSPEAHPTPFSPEMIMLPEGFGYVVLPAAHCGRG
jgi:hypothetical protein